MKFRKFAKITLAIALIFGSVFSFSGCGKDDNKQTSNEDEQYRIYRLAKEAGVTDLTYEEWLKTVKGEKGDKGDPGEAGSTGEQGPKGEKGNDGSTWLSGTVAPISDVGKVGDFYFDTVAKKIYEKESTGWILKTTIEDGVDGTTPSVEIGSNGNWFINGKDSGVSAKGQVGQMPVLTIVDGYWYIDGVNTYQKAHGDNGIDGREVEFKTTETFILWRYKNDVEWKTLVSIETLRGEKGDAGVSWLSGDNAPNNVDGRDNDLYFDTVNKRIYVKEEGEWVLKSALVDGETPTVEIGSNGNWFINGEDSGVAASGKDGNLWLSGEEAPSDDEGEEGYLYFDVINKNIYVKESIGWILKSTLVDGETPVVEIGSNGNWFINGKDSGVNAKGINGNNWLIGEGSPDNTVGNVGDLYLDTVNKNIFVRVKEGWNLKTSIVDGKTPTVEIGSNGNWFINGEDSGVAASGYKGREIELDTSDTHIRWRYVGDSEWTNLVALDEIKGESKGWLIGEGIPGNNVDGDIGDFYFDTVNNDIYIKTLDGWYLQVDLDVKEQLVVIEDNVTYTGEIMGKSFEVVFDTFDEYGNIYRGVKSFKVDGEDGMVAYGPRVEITGDIAVLSLLEVNVKISMKLGKDNTLFPCVTSDELGFLNGSYYKDDRGCLTVSGNSFVLFDGSSYFKGNYEVMFNNINNGEYILKLISDYKIFEVNLSYFNRKFNINVNDFSSTYFTKEGIRVRYEASFSRLIIGDGNAASVIDNVVEYRFEESGSKIYLSYEVEENEKLVKKGYILDYSSGVVNNIGMSEEAPFVGEYVTIYDCLNGQETGYYVLNSNNMLENVTEDGGIIIFNEENKLVFVSLIDKKVYLGDLKKESIVGEFSFDNVPNIDNEKMIFYGYNEELIKFTVRNNKILLVNVKESNSLNFVGERVKNKVEFVNAINDSEVNSIVLMDNIDLDMGVTINRELIVYLNNNKLSAYNDSVGDGVFHVINGGKLTINGDAGIIDGCNKSGYAMALWADGGEIIINSGKFTNVGAGTDDQYDLIYAKNGGTIEINGGYFISQTPKWTLNVNNTNKGTIVVNGGDFYDFDPSNAYTDDNGAENNPVSYVSDFSLVNSFINSAGIHTYHVSVNGQYDVYMSNESNVNFIKENYFNKDEEEFVNAINNNKFYTLVGATNSDVNIDRVYINGKYYTNANVDFYMGNGNYLSRPVWYVNGQDLYISSLLLKSFALDNEGQLEIKVETYDDGDYHLVNDISLVVIGYSSAEFYQNVSGLGVYKGNGLSSEQDSLSLNNDKYVYVSSNNDETIRFYVGDNGLDGLVFFVFNNVVDVESGESFISCGYGELEKIDDKYYVVIYPNFPNGGETKNYIYNYSFVLDNGIYGNYVVDATLIGQQ